MQTISFIVLRNFAKVQHKLDLPQGNWVLIFTIKIAVYKLPYELSNELKLKILRDFKILLSSPISQQDHSLVSSLSSDNKCLALTIKKCQSVWSIFADFFYFSKYILQKIVVCLKTIVIYTKVSLYLSHRILSLG